MKPFAPNPGQYRAVSLIVFATALATHLHDDAYKAGMVIGLIAFFVLAGAKRVSKGLTHRQSQSGLASAPASERDPADVSA